MDRRIKPSEFYIIDRNNNTSYEDNQENSNEAIYDTEGWGENGVVAKLINIATTTNDPTTTRIDVDGQEELPSYYVEKPINFGIIENT